MSDILFKVDHLNARYGSLQVLYDVSLSIAPGERVAIFGHNGSGKSTLLKCLVGGLAECDGDVSYRGQRIEPGAVHRNVQLGIGMVPQTRNVFPNLTVRQCLEIAGTRSGEREFKAVFDLFPRLKERVDQKAGLMSGGEQQMLAVGMALTTQPGAILLDEPTAGLSPVAARTVLASLVDVNERAGVAIVLVEQNVMLALEIAERAIVVKSGKVVFDGAAGELAESKNLWALF
ncbi:MAG: ABC transporter ATP-binding protein [Haliea sp.]|nr:MAG: ABC transporter ATP-binding protein [Haliea sp.]